MIVEEGMYIGSFVRNQYSIEHDWYEHELESVVENENFRILWVFIMQCDHMIEARRPDIVVANKVEKETMIIYVAIPGDTRVCDKK